MASDDDGSEADAADGRGSDGTASAILRAASELLEEGGPAAVSTRAVAARAGVTTMGIVTRFGNKAGVIDGLYREGFGRLRHALEAQPMDDDPVADVLRVGRIYRETANANRSHFRVMFGKPFPEYEPSADAAREALQAFNPVIEVAGRLIGSLGLDREAEDVAFQLWAAVHGVTSLEHAHMLSPSRARQLNVSVLDDLIRGVSAD